MPNYAWFGSFINEGPNPAVFEVSGIISTDVIGSRIKLLITFINDPIELFSESVPRFD